jgi:predicted cupin superfamily sugar epimerase
MVSKEVKKIVEKLQLQPHPEGGFYKEVYRSEGIIPQSGLLGFTGDRNFCTSIYFLLTSDNFSAFHRIKQDEIWHFYKGSPLYVHVIDKEGNYTRNTVGLDMEKGEVPQLVVPAGCWFASSVKFENDFSFVGCTVAPGFDFEDFELAEKVALTNEYPTHANIISQLTRI